MTRPWPALRPDAAEPPSATGAETTALRVAVITAEWGPPWNEGVRNIARCLVEFLKTKGAEVSVIAPGSGVWGERGGVVGVPLVRSIAFSLSAARRARRLGADVVVLFASLSPVIGLRSWALRRWTRRPLLLYVTGRRRRTFGYRVLLRADGLVVNSPALATFFPRADVVPPVTDPRRWRPTGRRTPPEPPVILFLGAFDRCRGVEYLIRSMDHLPNELGATLRLAWNGAGRHRYAHILRTIRKARASERIQLVESMDIVRLYTEASVVVIPRIAPERMAFPLRIVEAVHMGVPLVVTRVNRMDELVDGCGLAVPPRDPSALAAAITRLLVDRDLYARLAAGCREKARVWDPRGSLEAFHAAILRCR